MTVSKSWAFATRLLFELRNGSLALLPERANKPRFFFFKSKREKEGFLFPVKICSKNAHFGPRKFGRMAAKV